MTMSRTTRFKLTFLGALAALGVPLFFAWRALGGGPGFGLALAAVCLIPGRVLGVSWRELLRGRRLLSAGRCEESIPHTERFLALVRSEPWRKRLIWLALPIYTADVEAMALSNLGAAQLGLGRIAAARACFEEALAIDALYPIPHFNLAILHELAGDRAAAAQASAEAVRLGYTGGRIDAVIRAGQAAYASIEGRQLPGA